MKILQVITLAAGLALSGGVALADESAMDALSSASNVSVMVVSSPEQVGLIAPNAEQVDLASLRAQIKNDHHLLAQLSYYGAGINDVVGISGSSEKDVTLYVLG